MREMSFVLEPCEELGICTSMGEQGRGAESSQEVPKMLVARSSSLRFQDNHVITEPAVCVFDYWLPDVKSKFVLGLEHVLHTVKAYTVFSGVLSWFVDAD